MDVAVDVNVRFEPAGRSARVPAGTTLLRAAHDAGMPIASACGAEGVCGACRVSILSGDPPREEPAERSIKERNRVDTNLRLACRMKLVSDLIVTAPYW